MRRIRSVVLTVSAISMAVSACSESPPADARTGSSTQAIIGGTVDAAGPDRDWVVSVVTGSNALSIGVCSGSLVTPNHVLTAAHCVLKVDGNGELAQNGYTVQLGPNANAPTYTTKTKKVLVEPNAAVPITVAPGRVELATSDFDMALLELSERILPDRAVPRRPHVTGDGALPTGLTVADFRGYGASIRGADCSLANEYAAGVRRYGLDFLVPDGGFYSGAFVWNHSPSEIQTGYGDSGGPLILSPVGSGTTYFVGVLSIGQSDCTSTTWTSTMSDATSDWLVLALAKFGGRWRGEDSPYPGGDAGTTSTTTKTTARTTTTRTRRITTRTASETRATRARSWTTRRSRTVTSNRSS